MTSLDFSTILPEVVLAGYALAALMAGAYLGKDRLARTLLWVTVAAFLVVAAWWASATMSTAPPSTACSSTTASRALPRW